MKKLTPRRLPHKLVLRGEAIARLTPTQLGQVAGATMLGDCNRKSNLEVTCASDDQ